MIISSISNKKFISAPENAMFCFYGCKYEKKQRDAMNKLLDEKFHILYKELEVYDLPSNFPECYHSESLKRDFYYSNIAINNGKHILLLAKKVQDLFKYQNEYQTFSLKEKINQRILSLFSQKKQQLLIYYEDLYLLLGITLIL